MSDFQFSVSLIKDNPDGSADYQINLDETDKNNIVRWAIIEMLKKAIEEGKNLDPGKDNLEDA
jgi:hypothetical protein